MSLLFIPLRGKGQKGHKSCVFDGLFDLSLTAGTVAAALAGVYLAAMRQQLLQRLDIFIIDVLFAASAKPALCLLTRGDSACFHIHFIVPTSAKAIVGSPSLFKFRHISPFTRAQVISA